MAPAMISQKDDRYTSGKSTEEQVDMRATVAQRINREGVKIEDLAGTGEQDSMGG
jgi:hypothetical protein